MQPLLRYIIFSVLSFFITQSSQSQNPVNALKTLYDLYPQEKIYIWFNKAEYVSGETMWFKIYVFSGYELSNISKSVYLELYDKEKKLISDLLFPLIGGIGQGSLSLPENLTEDVYYVRAYTRWMMNFDDVFQFIKPIPVYNPSSSSRLIKKRAGWIASVHPEGNTFIGGVKTKIAVRLTSEGELPSEWSGYLFEKGKESVRLTEFRSLDKNVSAFMFTPDAGKQYLISITDSEGNNKIISLPPVRTGGVALQVTNGNDTIFCRLTFENLTTGSSTYSLVGQIQQQLVYFASFKRIDGLIKIPIPSKEMYNGILHLTLFDESNNIIVERLVFTNPDKLTIEDDAIGSNNFSGVPRSGNTIDIKIDSLSWYSYAVSVSNAELQSSIASDNLLSTLWLTSDLTTSVKDAASYFNSDHRNNEALDALLITEKWKRFKWGSVLNNSFPVLKYLPHNYLSFKGVAFRNKKLLPAREVTFIFYAADSSSQLMLARTDSAATIQFDNITFEGEVKAFYQLNEKKGNPKNIDIRFERDNKHFPFTQKLPQHEYLLVPRIASTLPSWLVNAQQSLNNERSIEDQYKTLQEVIVRSRTKTAKAQLNEKLTSGIFRSHNDIIFDFINEEQNALAYTNILQWLEGRVAGLTVEFENGIYTPYIRGDRASVFLDEMPYDAEGLSMLSISDIAMVKVIKGPMSFVTGGGAGGVIAIYTAKGNMRPAQREPSLNNEVLYGYDSEKIFFSPDYSDKIVSLSKNDVRDQLLWTSLVIPARSLTTSTLHFVNNDKPGKLRIIVQGFTDKGFPVFSERIIEPSRQSF